MTNLAPKGAGPSGQCTQARFRSLLTADRFHLVRNVCLLFPAFLSLVALCATPTLHAQSTGDTGVIEGVVTEQETGAALPGANVLVAGTSIGTATQVSGAFRIENVPTGTQVLRVSLVGYKTAQTEVVVSAGATETVRIQLAEGALKLDEVVVTGVAGGEQKRALGNAIAQVDATETREIATVSNVTDLIRGRAPGVLVQMGGTMVGAGSQIRMRGISSLSLFEEQPLLYVDGVRVDNAIGGVGPQNQFPGQSSGGGVMSRFDDFAPSEIESIEVIKGPAAATLFGTEASNGVVQIITRRGQYGQSPTVRFSSRQGVNWFRDAEDRWPDHYFRDPDTGEVETLNLIANERRLGNEVFRNGYVQGYSASVEGGAEDVRYFASLSYDDEKGYQPTNDQQQFSGRLNVGVNLHPTLTADANVGIISGETQLAGEVFRGIWPSLWSAQPTDESTRGWGGATPDAWYDLESHTGTLQRYTTGLRLQHQPVEGFTQRLQVGLDVVNEDNQTLTRGTALNPRYEGFQLGFGTPPQGRKLANRREAVSTTLDYAATLETDLPGAFSSRTSFGAQLYDQTAEFTNAQGQDFPAPGLESIGSTAITFGDDGRIENTTVGVYLQEQIGWNDRAFLTAALRADDNSAFGDAFNVVAYPKLSGSWVVSEEPFWSVPGVSTLRLRAAYGQSGQQPDAFAALTTYRPVPRANGTPAITPEAIGNSALEPERGVEIEAGFEAGFLADRITLDFTYYDQTVRNALLQTQTAPSNGFAGVRLENVGELQNRGIELLLDALAVDTRVVDWGLTLNVAFNDNEVVDVGGDREFIPSTFRGRHQEGFPAFSWFDQRIVAAEFDANGNVINARCDGGTGQGGVEPGGPAVACDEAPAVFLGQAVPKWTGSVSTNVVLFDRLRLYGLVDFNAGFKQYNNTYGLRCSFGQTCELNFFPERFDPRTVASFQLDGSYDADIQTADFAKLRELSVQYVLPSRWLDPLGLSRATVTVAGRNLAIFSSWSGLDPEGYQIGRPDRIGRQGLNAPAPTQVVTKLALTF